MNGILSRITPFPATDLRQYLPSANRPRGTVKIHANLHHPPAVCLIRNGILLAVNLRQRLLGGTVVFELENINGILQLHHHIRTA